MSKENSLDRILEILWELSQHYDYFFIYKWYKFLFKAKQIKYLIAVYIIQLISFNAYEAVTLFKGFIYKSPFNNFLCILKSLLEFIIDLYTLA